MFVNELEYEIEKAIAECGLDTLQFHYVDVVPAMRIYPKTGLYQTAVKQGLLTNGDPLLWPLFYPVAEPVAATIQQLAGERANCHPPGYVQYITTNKGASYAKSHPLTP